MKCENEEICLKCTSDYFLLNNKCEQVETIWDLVFVYEGYIIVGIIIAVLLALILKKILYKLIKFKLTTKDNNKSSKRS